MPACSSEFLFLETEQFWTKGFCSLLSFVKFYRWGEKIGFFLGKKKKKKTCNSCGTAVGVGGSEFNIRFCFSVWPWASHSCSLWPVSSSIKGSVVPSLKFINSSLSLQVIIRFHSITYHQTPYRKSAFFHPKHAQATLSFPHTALHGFRTHWLCSLGCCPHQTVWAVWREGLHQMHTVSVIKMLC